MQGMIELLHTDQTKTLQPIMKKSFGLFGWFMAFDVGDHTLVYKEDDTILGGIVCGTIQLSKSKKLGMIKYLFTHPDAQGKGVAKKLFAAAMEHFESSGYAEVAGCVEGHNTASSNLFAKHGFAIRSTSDQWRRYHKALPKVWFKGNHQIDIGYFWWSKALNDTIPNTPEDRHAKPLGAWWIQVLFHACLVMLLTLRQGWGFNVHILWQAPLVSLVLFGLKFIPMRLAAKRLQFPVVYRYWETGMILAALITLLFSGVFISFGGLYPNQAVWREDKQRQKLFMMTLPSVLVLLVASALSVFLIPVLTPTVSNPLNDLLFVLRFYVPFVAFLDLLFAISLMNGMGGGRIRKVSPLLWAVFLVIAALLMAMSLII